MLRRRKSQKHTQNYTKSTVNLLDIGPSRDLESTDDNQSDDSDSEFSELVAHRSNDGKIVQLGQSKKKFRLRVPFTHSEDQLITMGLSFILIVLVTILYMTWYYPQYVQLHTARAYGYLGYEEAQYQAGIRYLRGHGGEEQNRTKAVEWLKMGHERGHVKSGFWLAHTHVSFPKEVGKHTGLAGMGKEHLKDIFAKAAEAGMHQGRHMWHKCDLDQHDCNV